MLDLAEQGAYADHKQFRERLQRVRGDQESTKRALDDERRIKVRGEDLVPSIEQLKKTLFRAVGDIPRDDVEGVYGSSNGRSAS